MLVKNSFYIIKPVFSLMIFDECFILSTHNSLKLNLVNAIRKNRNCFYKYISNTRRKKDDLHFY